MTRIMAKLGLLLTLFVPSVAFVVTPIRSPSPTVCQMTSSSMKRDELLSTQGDWQAYFDSEDYGLIYYFNRRTGDSTWEAPKNFRIPKLSDAHLQIFEQKRARIQQKESSSSSSSNSSPPPSESFLDNLFNLLGSILSKSRSSDKPWNQSNNDKSWVVRLSESFLAHVFRKESTRPLVPPIQASDSEILKILSDDDEREKILTEKRYAASRARQENLRRTFGHVVEQRSPTISLSAMKREKKKEWYQYLDDE